MHVIGATPHSRELAIGDRVEAAMKRRRSLVAECLMHCALVVLVLAQSVAAWPMAARAEAVTTSAEVETVTTPCGHVITRERAAPVADDDGAGMPCCEEGDCGLACYRVGAASLLIELPLAMKAAPGIAPADALIHAAADAPRIPPTPPPIPA